VILLGLTRLYLFIYPTSLAIILGHRGVTRLLLHDAKLLLFLDLNPPIIAA